MVATPCNTSFHKWKDEIRQITKMDMQCGRLLECLRNAVDATKHAAPCGEPGPHPLMRVPRPNLEHCRSQLRECHWEESLWRKYGQDSSDPVPGLWARILSYQVMLRNENDADAGWGEIDLLGVTANGLPVVVELKSESCREPPLRMLVEGCAYGIALQCNNVFTQHFQQRLSEIRFGSPVPPALHQPVTIVCLAPCGYWSWCFGIKDNAVRSAWPLIKRLVEAMTHEGFLVIFAEIHHDGRDITGLPKITGVTSFQLPL